MISWSLKRGEGEEETERKRESGWVFTFQHFSLQYCIVEEGNPREKEYFGRGRRRDRKRDHRGEVIYRNLYH